MKAIFIWTSLFLLQVFCQTEILFYLEFQFQGNPSSATMREPNKCIKVSKLPQFHVKSVYSEFCVLLYSTTDCSENWIKQLRGNDRVSLEKPSTPEDPNNFYTFLSWFPCNKSFDGGPINVRIDGSSLYSRIGIHNVCECRRFDTGNTITYKYIGAGGNCIKIFSEEECKGRYQEVQNLYNASYPLQINSNNSTDSKSYIARSLSPCKIPRSCTFINGTIYRVDLYPSLKNQTSSFVDEQSFPVFTRNSSDTIDFFGTGTFVDTIQSLTPPGLEQGYGVWRKNSLDSNVFMTKYMGIPILDEEKWRKRFLSALLVSFGTGPVFENITKTRNMTFTTSKPALKHGYYVADSKIIIQRQFAVPYIVHMRVLGKWGSGQPMADYDLKEKMPENVMYINSTNDYTIYVQIEGYLNINFASATVYNITEVLANPN